MTSTNDITGDRIISKTNSDKYRNNYDKIFRKKKELDIEENKKEKECSLKKDGNSP